MKWQLIINKPFSLVTLYLINLVTIEFAAITFIVSSKDLMAFLSIMTKVREKGQQTI